MSHSETAAPQAGFTLFEALVSLAILAAILAIVSTAFRPPSPALVLNRRTADLMNEVARVRAKAVQQGYPESMTLPSCNKATVEALFFPDGTAFSIEACLIEGPLTRLLIVDPITARVIEKKP